MSIAHIRVVISIGTLAVVVPGLQAQIALGGVTGTVRDTTGAVIPGASIRVVNLATGIEHNATTQVTGSYLVPQVAAGDYRISVSATGFKQIEIVNAKVDVGTTLTQDVTLEVGQVNESIQVEGQSSLVDTTSGQVGTTIQTGYVLEMPLADRNVFRLVNLVPAHSTGAATSRWAADAPGRRKS
jgi:hypothetical protein